MSDKPKATAILVQFDDGSELVSKNAAHAADIWDWLVGCEIMSSIHGAKFTGEPLVKHDGPSSRGNS